MENFITSINIHKSNNIEDLLIPLSDTIRQHLIITGKNGSGKTSLLKNINNFFKEWILYNPEERDNLKNEIEKLKLKVNNLDDENRYLLKLELQKKEELLKNYYHVQPELKFGWANSSSNKNWIFSTFEAKRNSFFRMPTGISKIYDKPTESFSSEFIQHLVNLKADRSFARDDGDEYLINEIDEWFINLENALAFIFGVKTLSLKFNRNKYSFDIFSDDNDALSFDTLSDGYSSIISIISDILLRINQKELKVFEAQGIVLIDEIETHLHIDLQKKILPFLISFFPKIQFIVTTHSPFVITSESNAVVCDLEKKIVTTDLSNYSYDAIIESYFGSDKYSKILKDKVERFEYLALKDQLTSDENWELHELKDYMASAPKHLALELQSKLLEINLNLITKNKK